MTPLSWLYMGIVWAAILWLNVFCFYRIFKKKKKEMDGGSDEQNH
jgi:hypothetical protein